jgi:hypothetical protein
MKFSNIVETPLCAALPAQYIKFCNEIIISFLQHHRNRHTEKRKMSRSHAKEGELAGWSVKNSHREGWYKGG